MSFQWSDSVLLGGYVLDIWGVEEKIIVGRHQLYEVTNTRPPIPAETPPNPEEKVESGGEVVEGEEQSLQSLDSYQYKPTSTEDKRPQLILELQVREEWLYSFFLLVIRARMMSVFYCYCVVRDGHMYQTVLDSSRRHTD